MTIEQIIVGLVVLLVIVLVVGTIRINPTEKYVRDMILGSSAYNTNKTNSRAEKSFWLFVVIIIIVLLFKMTA